MDVHCIFFQLFYIEFFHMKYERREKNCPANSIRCWECDPFPRESVFQMPGEGNVYPER